MPVKRNGKDGRLEEAMALLIQNQAAFVSQLSAVNDRFARMDDRFARMDERLTRIERILEQHHETLLALPDTIREKIGFKARQ